MIYSKIMELPNATAQGLLLQRKNKTLPNGQNAPYVAYCPHHGPLARSTSNREGPAHSPLDLREILGLKDAPSLQWLRDLPSEEESPLGEIYQDVADDFTQVHTADHLLIPGTRGGDWASI